MDVVAAVERAKIALCAPGEGGAYIPLPAPPAEAAAAAANFRYLEGRIYEFGPCELPPTRRNELRIFRYADSETRDAAIREMAGRNTRPTSTFAVGDTYEAQIWSPNPSLEAPWGRRPPRCTWPSAGSSGLGTWTSARDRRRAVDVGPAVAPGGDVGCDVHLTNPSGAAVTVGIAVDGPAGGWAVVLPSTVVLPPEGTARARVTFTVPDDGDLAGSNRPFSVRVTGGSTVPLPGRVDIAEVLDIGVSIRPLVARGRGASSHTVTVENRGTRRISAALVASGTPGLKLDLPDQRVTVDPGERVTADLVVAPLRRFATGRPRPHPFTVEVRPETGPPVAAQATRFQDPARWQRGMVAAAVAVVVAATVAVALRSSGSPGADPFATVAAAPAAPVALTPTCPAAGRAAPPRHRRLRVLPGDRDRDCG